MYFYRRRNRLRDAELDEDDMARTPRTQRPTTDVPASQRRPRGMNEAVGAGMCGTKRDSTARVLLKSGEMEFPLSK